MSNDKKHTEQSFKKPFLKKYDIAGLQLEYEQFEYEQRKNEIEVRCQLPTSDQHFVVAKLIRKNHIVDIDDFMWENQYDSEYTKFYVDAKAIVKKNGRTFSGVVMEVIKKSLDDEDFLNVSVNVWTTSQGNSSINSKQIKEVATKVMKKKKLNKFEQDIFKYIEYRYKQLHPFKEVLFEDYLKHLSVRGWYGAWLPIEQKVFKTDIIDTKTNKIFYDHC